MAYRSFRDSAGVEWDTWDVVPQLAERRVEDRRQVRGRIQFRDRRHRERRMVASWRAVMAPGLAGGWLCFEGATERRRLSPIPSDWARCEEARLEDYCRKAKPVRRSTEVGFDHRPRPG